MHEHTWTAAAQLFAGLACPFIARSRSSCPKAPFCSFSLLVVYAPEPQEQMQFGVRLGTEKKRHFVTGVLVARSGVANEFNWVHLLRFPLLHFCTDLCRCK